MIVKITHKVPLINESTHIFVTHVIFFLETIYKLKGVSATYQNYKQKVALDKFSFQREQHLESLI